MEQHGERPSEKASDGGMWGASLERQKKAGCLPSEASQVRLAHPQIPQRQGEDHNALMARIPIPWRAVDLFDVHRY